MEKYVFHFKPSEVSFIRRQVSCCIRRLVSCCNRRHVPWAQAGRPEEWRTPPGPPTHPTHHPPGDPRGRERKGLPFHFTSILGGFSFPLQGKGEFLSHTPTGSADDGKRSDALDVSGSKTALPVETMSSSDSLLVVPNTTFACLLLILFLLFCTLERSGSVFALSCTPFGILKGSCGGTWAFF